MEHPMDGDGDGDGDGDEGGGSGGHRYSNYGYLLGSEELGSTCVLDREDDDDYDNSGSPESGCGGGGTGAGGSSSSWASSRNIKMERNRRQRLKEKLYGLRSVVPNITKKKKQRGRNRQKKKNYKPMICRHLLSFFQSLASLESSSSMIYHRSANRNKISCNFSAVVFTTDFIISVPFTGCKTFNSLVRSRLHSCKPC